MADGIVLTCLACGRRNRVEAARLGDGPKCGACGAALAAGEVAELTPELLEAAAGSDGLPLLVDLWAPWCGPCRMMAPEFAKAARTLAPGVRLAKLDTERFPEAAARHRVQGIPLLILFEGGREVARLTGARPAGEIVRFVRERLPRAA